MRVREALIARVSAAAARTGDAIARAAARCYARPVLLRSPLRLVAVLALSACAPYGSAVRDRNTGRIDVQPTGYSVAPVELLVGEKYPSRKKVVGRYVGKDWTIVSHDHFSGQLVDQAQDRRTLSIDFDGDGRADTPFTVPAVDFELRNGVNRSALVGRTIYLDATEEGLDLRAWTHDVVGGHSGAVYWRRYERRFTSRIATESRRELAGLEAHDATIEVTDVDRLHFVANNVDQVISLVVVRMPKRVCVEGGSYRCVPALVTVWCESERVDAPSCRRDLESLLSAITWPKKS